MHRHPGFPKAFVELGLEVPALRAVATLGFKEPSPIQRELIPLILAGKDVIGQARTGTGKTAAFGLPTLQMIDPTGRTQLLVLAPTRELAVQVIGEFLRLAQFMEVRCVPVYGGTRMRHQLAQLGHRPHVVVGTPGRVMDVLSRKALSLEAVRFVVLDEVDRMLDIGFRDDIRRILGQVTHPHQTIFVSATIEDEIKRLSQQFMRSPVEVNVSGDQLTVNEVSQYYCPVDPHDKFHLLMRLLEQEQPSLAIVFCNTKHAVRKLAKRLHAAGIDAKEIHGDLIQERRERIMTRFRKLQIPVLVATDLAARGIDVRQISHIVNYDLPQDAQAYIHRIGRTARMGATGKAITFVSMEEGGQLTEVEKLINKEVQLLTVEGFRPRPAAAPAGVLAASAATSPTTVAAESQPAPAMPRTLGGKFPIRRRGRRH
ncbi:MAG TPA: DEAD/DEAH box helicase [Phycisphaerae bacterium]|nr:DEAD/DEAH box helicase [Phycisphaerae bacterium]